jgi:hypothetical protein
VRNASAAKLTPRKRGISASARKAMGDAAAMSAGLEPQYRARPLGAINAQRPDRTAAAATSDYLQHGAAPPVRTKRRIRWKRGGAKRDGAFSEARWAAMVQKEEDSRRTWR